MRKALLALTVLAPAGCATRPTAPRKDKELSRVGDPARAAFEDGAIAKAAGP